MGRGGIAIKNTVKALVLLILGLLLFLGCSLENPLLDDIKDLVFPYIIVKVFDKDSGEPISGASLILVEEDISETLDLDSYEVALDSGVYTLYVSMPGYRTRGYVVELDESDIEIKAGLKGLTSLGEPEDISGNVTGVDAYYLSWGTANVHDINDANSYTEADTFTVSSPCGTVTLAAFTQDAGEVDAIAYLKNLLLSQHNPLSGLSIAFPGSPITFSGQRPNSHYFRIKLSEGFLLAQDKDTDTSYSFQIDLQSGDALRLEAVTYDSFKTYFTRKNAGSSGGSVNIAYEVGLPALSVKDSGDSFTVSFSKISGATHYEAYIMEAATPKPKVTLQITNLTGDDIKIPKSLINTEAGLVNLYLSAVNIAGYNQTQLLNNTLSLEQYSYRENGQTLIDNGGSMHIAGGTKPGFNYRRAQGFDYLLMEE